MNLRNDDVTSPSPPKEWPPQNTLKDKGHNQEKTNGKWNLWNEEEKGITVRKGEKEKQAVASDQCPPSLPFAKHPSSKIEIREKERLGVGLTSAW